VSQTLPSLSWREIEPALRRAGFVYAPKRGKGSHRAYTRVDAVGIRRLAIVPMGKDVPRGTMHSILQQAGMTSDEFLRYL